MNSDVLIGIGGGLLVGLVLGWVFGGSHHRNKERLRVVEWLKAASGPTDAYPSKLADLIALGAHDKQ